MGDVIVSNSTRKEAGKKLSELICEYYMGNSMGQSIGFNNSGSPDYRFNVYGARDIVLEVFNSNYGDSFFGDEDPRDPELWTDEFIEEFGDALMDPDIFYPNDPEDDIPEIVFREE